MDNDLHNKIFTEWYNLVNKKVEHIDYYTTIGNYTFKNLKLVNNNNEDPLTFSFIYDTKETNMIQQINNDFIEARKSGNTVKKTFLGVLKGEIQLAQSRENFNDDSVTKIIKKMEKSLLNAIKNGDDTAKEELEYLKPYLPQMMSENDISEIVKELISNGSNNIGMIMKEFNTKYKGQADNNLVKNIALSLLNNK